MAEPVSIVDKKQLRDHCVNPNFVATSPSESSVSGLRCTVNLSGEQPAAECAIMGASFQPSRSTAEPLQAEKQPPKQDDSYPSSLHSTSTSGTYSLEISLSTTTMNNNSKVSRPLTLKTHPDSKNCKNEEPKHPSSPDYLKPVSSVTNLYTSSDPMPLKQKKGEELKFSQHPSTHGSPVTTSPSIASIENTFLSSSNYGSKLGAQPVSKIQPPKPTSTHEYRKSESFSKEKQFGQEDEDTFYAFVILHSQEDSEEAVRLKTRLESISSTTGATFSENFAVPGHSIFKCVEDAIENSAYVMVLLTANFNTCLNETNADSALMNSIDKPHKYNTVIPLLPRANSLTRDQIPLILKTKNPLVETKNREMFDKIARKVLDWKTIEKQKSIWRKEQRVKKQREIQQRLQVEKKYCGDFIKEATKVRELQEQVQLLQMQQKHILPSYAFQSNLYQGVPERPQTSGHMPFQNQQPSDQNPNPILSYQSENTWQQHPSHIHIQNAKYIMIGNDSTMTVGGTVDSGEEDDF